MSNSRDDKRERFAGEGKRSRLNIKPVSLIGLVIVVMSIGVAVALVSANSGTSDGDTENSGQIPAASETENTVTEMSEVDPGDAEVIPASLTTSLKINGMTCGGCENSVKGALNDVEGVESCDVSWKDKNGVIEYDPEAITPQYLADFVTGMGFPASVDE